MKTPKTKPLQSKPFLRILLGGLGLVIVYFVFALWGEITVRKIPPILGDLLLCIGGVLFWLFFFAQFILPLRKVKDRELMVARIFDYLTGAHGPALFIESGTVRERKNESNRNGPGLIWLDSASAAHLRTATGYTQAVGPGVVFTRANEYVGGTMDLHIQTSRLGPPDDEIYIINRLLKETKEHFDERYERRMETQGITRDSHEIVPNITVTFRLDAREGEGGTLFGYRQASVEKAVIGRPIDAVNLTDTKEVQSNWQLLPVHLAVNVWREVLAKFTLAQLFQPSDEPDQGALQRITNHVRDRLQKPHVNFLDEYGNPILQRDPRGNPILGDDGKPSLLLEASPEYEILQARGLRVIGANIFNLRLRKDIDEELFKGWKNSWLDRARREQEAVERRRNLASEEGREIALRDFALGISQVFGAQAPPAKWRGPEILKRLLEGNLQLGNGDAQLIPMTEDDVIELNSLLEWLEKGQNPK